MQSMVWLKLGYWATVICLCLPAGLKHLQCSVTSTLLAAVAQLAFAGGLTLYMGGERGLIRRGGARRARKALSRLHSFKGLADSSLSVPICRASAAVLQLHQQCLQQQHSWHSQLDLLPRLGVRGGGTRGEGRGSTVLFRPHQCLRKSNRPCTGMKLERGWAMPQPSGKRRLPNHM